MGVALPTVSMEVASVATAIGWRLAVGAAAPPHGHLRLRGDVTAGMFGRVRNPIFTAMLLFASGVALAADDALSALGALALLVGIVLQVLVVEEPYLAGVHGAAYATYRARAGRFLPRLTGLTGLTGSTGHSPTASP